MEKRGYISGTVCPVIPTPVGTGVLIAGGNYNRTDHNWIYDNWRYGTMQFWVPAPLRDEFDPAKLFDTSHHNHTTHNHMGFTKDGKVRAQRHGPLVGRRRASATAGRTTSTPAASRPTTSCSPPRSCESAARCCLPGLPVKDAGFLTCNQYDRADPILRHPPAVHWFDSPTRPSGSRSAREHHRRSGPEADGPTGALLAVAGRITLIVGLRRRRPGSTRAA